MLFRNINDSKINENTAKHTTTIKEYNEAWAEFSVPQAMSEVLTKVFNELNVIANSKNIPIQIEQQFHLTLIYGYTKLASEKLMDIVRKYKGEVFTVEFENIHYGDFAKDQIMVKIKPHQELQDLFMDIYRNVPSQHTLIDGGYYPHVTISKVVTDEKFFNSDPVKNLLIKNNLSLDELKKQIKERKFSFDQILPLDNIKNSLKGKKLTIDHIISYEDSEGLNKVLDQHIVGKQQIATQTQMRGKRIDFDMTLWRIADSNKPTEHSQIAASDIANFPNIKDAKPFY